MSHCVIPYYRPSQYAQDLVRCPGMFRGVRTTKLLLPRPVGRRGAQEVAPDSSLPDLLEMAGYWAATDDTPTKPFKPEWKGLMKYTKYLRGVQNERRAAKRQHILVKRVLRDMRRDAVE